MPKASKFDDRDVDVIINEQREKERKHLRFNRPKPYEIINLYHKINKKYAEVANDEIFDLINVFAKFYVLMDNRERIGNGGKINRTSREFAIDKLNVQIKQLVKKDGYRPRAKILEDLFKKEIKNYKADLESVYKIYKSNVLSGNRNKKITAGDMSFFLQNYTP